MFWAVYNQKKILASPNLRALCPVCNQEVISKCGRIKVWHWAHKSKEDCDSWAEPETIWHKEWKDHFPKEWQEVTIKNHRADIKTPYKVIELQNSSISSEEIQAREEFYGNMVWILNGKKFLDNFIFNEKESFLTFRWRYPRKCWFFSTKKIYIDFTEQIKKLIRDVRLYKEGKKTHTSPIYETYEFYNEYIDDYMEGEKIIGSVDDTPQEIERIDKLISLLENKLFLIKKIYKNTPCGGWGILIPKEEFIRENGG